jgi:integrase
MSRQPRIPKYRRHKQSGQAIVTLPDGLGSRRDVLLGKYRSKESKAEYERVIGEWLAAGRRVQQRESPTDLTINELIVAYWRHASEYYRHLDGTPTSEVHNLKLALRPLRQLYGHTPGGRFDSLALEALREHLIRAGLCRNRINKDVARIKRVFQWAAAKKLAPLTVYQSLQTVDGLRAGRTGARETSPVKPVAEALVEATIPYLRPQLAAMVRLQLHTGMRPGEVVQMRTIDLDTSGKIWVYRPGSDQGPHGKHKTSWRGQQRLVLIGPRGQEVLKAWLRLNIMEYLFQPQEAEATRDVERRKNRKTKVQPSQAARRRKHRPKRTPTDRYTIVSYACAVRQACLRAGARVQVVTAPDDPTAAITVTAFTKSVLIRTMPHAFTGRLTRVAHQGLTIREQRHQRECSFTMRPDAEVSCDGRACRLEDLPMALPHWHPNQLRHAKATEIRREAGLDAARVVLGHRSPQITEVYAEIDVNKAAEVMAKLG